MQKNDRSGDDNQRDSVSEHQLFLFAFASLFIFPLNLSSLHTVALHLDSLHFPSSYDKTILISSTPLYNYVRVWANVHLLIQMVFLPFMGSMNMEVVTQLITELFDNFWQFISLHQFWPLGRETPKRDTHRKCEMTQIWNRLVNMPELSHCCSLERSLTGILRLVRWNLFQNRSQCGIHDAQHKFLFMYNERLTNPEYEHTVSVKRLMRSRF